MREKRMCPALHKKERERSESNKYKTSVFDPDKSCRYMSLSCTNHIQRKFLPSLITRLLLQLTNSCLLN